MQEGEELPIGLILCAEGNTEQIELLQLDNSVHLHRFVVL